ncbi:MAG TPA: two-component regulator propeller domain-containing protein [Pyrinomonadaceae bacterium]|nr:two-component regulator propeller domain-containing protein [Pyrinomonadaceae bacterium]
MKAPAKNLFIVLSNAALFLLFLFLIQIEAAKLPFRAFTTADGLADDRVNRIIRDSRGFLWFCTSEGLSRFDGYEFKNYTQADGLPHRNINDLLELENEIYLIATSDGMTVFDPNGSINAQTGAAPMFRAFRPSDVKSDGKSAIIRDLHKNRAGEIWAATMDGFYRLSTENGEWHFTRIEHELWQSHLRLLEFITILEDRRGALWLGMPNGLFRFEPSSGKISLIFKAGVQSLLEDRGGRIWVGSGSGSNYGINLYVFPEGEDQPVPAQNFTKKNGLAAEGWINYLMETSDGRILAVTPNDLCEFQPHAQKGEPDFRTIVSSVDGVSLGEDGGGNGWLGTNTLGALKLASRGFVIYGESEGVPAAEINAVFGGGGEEVFAVSGVNEMLRFDGVKFTSVKPFGMTGRGWGWNQIDFRSRFDGDWWIATFQGVRRYPAVEKFEDLARVKPKKIYKTGDGLYTDEVFRMWEDSRGNVWIYVFGKIGDEDSYLHLWERATDKIRRFGKAEGLPHTSNVTAFAEDRAGNVWLGFYGGGAARFRNGRFHYYSVQEGFPSGFVNAAYTDREGRVWIATGNSGIVRIDNPTDDEPRFVNITVAQGLSSNRATCLTEDNFGRIYIGTGRGISRIEPNTGRIKLYSQADGLPYSAVQNCGRDALGNLWFRQKFILARLTPAAEERSSPPPIFIADLLVNGERVEKLSELGETSVGNLELNPEQRQIQIEFFALGFSTGETLSYQYKFAGADWSEPSAQRTVNLNLAPGSYNFEVRAVNSEGAASEIPARVSFSIARPVWQRWWFLLSAALIVSAVIYLLYRYRLKRLIELERVRTRIATDLHDDIGSSLSQIAILSEVVRQKINAEGASEPLNLIAGTSREMVDSMADIVWAINPQKDHLSDMIRRMRQFSGDILEAKNIAFRFHLPEKLKDAALGADLRREIYLIFKECVNNLAKHSAATEAEISIRLENESLYIEIKDNGRGFDAAEKLDGTADGYGGNGLPNIKRRAASLNGEFIIASQPGRGTNISIKIPLHEKSRLPFF